MGWYGQPFGIHNSKLVLIERGPSVTKLVWGLSSTPLFEAGVDRGVVYPLGGEGIPWNGLVSVKESSAGASEVIGFYDGEKYRNQLGVGSYSAVVESFTYPMLLDDYETVNNGLLANSRRDIQYFNFTYRTGTDEHYKIHLVYNATATPSEKSYSSLGGSADAARFSFDISTLPIKVPGAKDSAHFILDSTVVYPWVLTQIENTLYGSAGFEPSFPTFDELYALVEDGSILKITDHGDGTWTADGPESVIQMLDSTTFEISWPSAVYLDADTYQISSL